MACVSCVLLSIVIIGVALKLYNKLTTGWCKSNICLVGKTAIVTGANTGIGYDTALDFAKRGARVILACRDEKRAEDARNRIIEETENKNVIVRLVNLDSFASVRAFVKQIKATEDRLDILVNNAGVGGVGAKETEDGNDLLMQTNHFSHFLLTILLIGLLKKTKNSRVVNVSSMLAKHARKFDVNMVAKRPGSYSESKLCNILFTMELAKRLEGTGVTTYSLHPGAVATEFQRHLSNIQKMIFNVLVGGFLKTSEEGAQTTIYCSIAKDLEAYSGQHFSDCQKVNTYKTAKAPGLAKKLWEISEKVVQLKPEEIQI